MSILAGLKAVFGFDGVSNSAMKIVDKIAGTDWTPQQQADFILKHAEATKYQSPMRRLIAGVYVIVWAIMTLTWLTSSIFARSFDYSGALLLAGDISTFLSSNINLAMNGILAFYFLVGMKR